MAKNENEFVIINETTREEYKVTMATAIVCGYIERQQGVLTSINGTAYVKNESGEQGDFIGNFNGRIVNGTMKYSLSELTHEQSEMMWSAIATIEENIFDQPAE